MSKLKKQLEEEEDDFFEINFEDFFEDDDMKKDSKEKLKNDDWFDENLLNDRASCLSIEEFYSQLIDKSNKKGLHSNFFHSLLFIKEKKLYSFFDEEKIMKVFYSNTEESVMFFNRMLENITELSEKFSNELIACINMVLKIQDDDNKRMIDFKAKLYLNMLSRFIRNKKEEISILEKINTNEKEMTEFLNKHINDKINFSYLTKDYTTVKSHIYNNYHQLSASCMLNQDGTLSKHMIDQRALNIGKSIAHGKTFQNYLLKKLDFELPTKGSALPYGICVTLSFVEIADIFLLKKLENLLEKKNIYKTAKEEWFIKKNPELVELLKDMDIKIAKEEQRYLNSMVNTDTKKKVNNRL